MGLTRKEVRSIVGLTHPNTKSNPEHWMKCASDFKEAALLIASQSDYSPPKPYYYNSGIALELALKATATAKFLEYKENHDLISLSKLVGLEISTNQEFTLKLLSVSIIWTARYPVPKKQHAWDHYHDDILEKHIIRTREGNSGSVLVNRDRFPTTENFLTLWSICEKEYQLALSTYNEAKK